MALIFKDRIKEGTTTAGTGAYALGGASATFDTFTSCMSNGDTTYYAVAHTASGTDEWEIGLGTFNTGNTLTRTTVLSGSNGTSAVNFSSGTKNIFMTMPADKIVIEDASNDVTVGRNLTITGDLTVSGTTTTVNSTTTTVDDPVFTLGGDTAPSSDDNKDRGIEFRYHTGSGAKVGFFGFDDSAGKFTFIPDATNSGEVFSGSAGTIVAALEGNSTTATTLATARNIAGQSFDGSANISIAPTDLTGVTATAAELNYTDGVTSNIQTQLDAKQPYHTIAVTVVNSGGNKYALDGTVQQTALLPKSVTIRFDQSDSSNSGHPLRLSTTSDGTHGGGSAFSTGVSAVGTPGSAGAYTQVTLEQDAPDLLYTYCTNHSGMGAKAYSGKDFSTLTSTIAELNILDGVTSTAAELNILDGVTSTAAELNILDGVTSTAAELNILDGVTSTATELNILDGVTATTAELNILDGVTSTTTELNILDGVTATTAELNKLDGVTATTAELNIIDGVTATTAELNYVDGVTSAIQTQLNAKLPLGGGQMTGNITMAGSQTVDGRDLSADGSKLDGIESGATADQTNAEIRAAVEAASDSNVFTDADHSKLNGIEASATADQSAAEIRALVESASDSNVFTDADHTKLNGITAGANFINNTNQLTNGAGYITGISSSNVTSALGYTPIAPDADAQLNTVRLYNTSGVRLLQNNTSNLQVQAGSGGAMGISGYGSDGGWDFQLYGSGGQQGFLTSNWGSWGAYCDTSGNWTAQGNVTAYSDERLKDNIEPIENPIEKIKAIQGVTYNRNDIEGSPRQTGVVAQQVEKVLPEVVMTSDDGIMHVAYGNMVGLLIEAIKEQQNQITELSDKLEALEDDFTK